MATSVDNKAEYISTMKEHLIAVNQLDNIEETIKQLEKDRARIKADIKAMVKKLNTSVTEEDLLVSKKVRKARPGKKISKDYRFTVNQIKISQLPAKRHKGIKKYEVKEDSFTYSKTGYIGIDTETSTLYLFKEKIDAALFIKYHILDKHIGADYILPVIYNRIGEATYNLTRNHYIFSETETDRYKVNRFQWYRVERPEDWSEVADYTSFFKVNRLTP